MYRRLSSRLFLSTMIAASVAAAETKPAAPADTKKNAPKTSAPAPGKTTAPAAPAPAPAPKAPAPVAKAPQAEAPAAQVDTVRPGIVLAGRWGGSAAFGVTHYSGDYGSGFGGIDGFGRVGLRWQPLEYLGARASAAYIRLHSSTGRSMRSDISMAEFDAVLQWPRSIFRPYLAGGPAIAHVSAYREIFGRTTDPDVERRPKSVRDKVVFVVPAEIGLEVLVSEDVSLFAFAGGTIYSGSDLLDGVEHKGDGLWGDKDDFKTFGGGMTFWINPMRDRDHDGVVDRLDQCPSQAEDRDGFQDEDGCPEADNDRDGISDLADKCPLQGEDYDGFQDEDGCPEADNDRDGVVDAKDRCPNDLEDLDGTQDEDGCPDLDNDRDGMLDAKDRCPNEPEDVDGAQDEDGCPDLDNDQDGIADKMDRCPNEKEVVNGVTDEDGCPDIGVMVGRSMVLEGIYFATNSAEILPESRPALEKAAESLLSLPDAMVEIRGYTDNVGNDRANQKLSQQRAESVRIFLVGLGVPAERITAKGFGRLNPIADNATEDGRAKNRRIEFYRVK